MHDFGKEPYQPTKAEAVCFYLNSVTKRHTDTFNIFYERSIHPNTISMIVRCHFVVDDEVRARLIPQFEEANVSLLESVESFFGFDWVKIDLVITQDPRVSTKTEGVGLLSNDDLPPV